MPTKRKAKTKRSINNGKIEISNWSYMKTMRKKYYVCNLYISIYAQIGMSFVYYPFIKIDYYSCCIHSSSLEKQKPKWDGKTDENYSTHFNQKNTFSWFQQIDRPKIVIFQFFLFYFVSVSTWNTTYIL